ncbi:MAG: carbohydrate kinase family protein [Candidatus Heimdallarchaeaceae archaeon]
MKLIYGGYDPTFIDIDIRPLEDESRLIKKFPPLGSHWLDTDIKFRPGGNGFNFCRALSTLGEKVTFVGPSNDFFQSLVKNLNLDLEIFPIKGAEVNYTAILNLYDGEVQFNNVRSKLSPNLLTPELLELFRLSPVKSISNVSLNPDSIEWVSSLLLSLVDASNPLITDISAKLEEKFKHIGQTKIDGIIFIDPSDISHYNRLHEFYKLLTSLKKFVCTKILSVNEYEMQTLCSIENLSPLELSKKLDLNIIFHTAAEVCFYSNKETITLSTRTLRKKVTFVGAGDVFNAAVVFKLLKNESTYDALKFGIEAGTYLIETGEYPREKNFSFHDEI